MQRRCFDDPDDDGLHPTPSNDMSSGRTNPDGPESNHEPPRAPSVAPPCSPKTALPCLNHPWNPYPELEAPPGGPLPSRNGEDSSSI